MSLPQVCERVSGIFSLVKSLTLSVEWCGVKLSNSLRKCIATRGMHEWHSLPLQQSSETTTQNSNQDRKPSRIFYTLMTDTYKRYERALKFEHVR